MAGGGHDTIRFDPAIERWSAMRENVYQTFKFTRRAARTVIVLGAVVPAAVALLAWKTDDKWDWAGKRRDESLLLKPTTAPADSA